jgi:hypothetical protein
MKHGSHSTFFAFPNNFCSSTPNFKDFNNGKAHLNKALIFFFFNFQVHISKSLINNKDKEQSSSLISLYQQYLLLLELHSLQSLHVKPPKVQSFLPLSYLSSSAMTQSPVSSLNSSALFHTPSISQSNMPSSEMPKPNVHPNAEISMKFVSPTALDFNMSYIQTNSDNGKVYVQHSSSGGPLHSNASSSANVRSSNAVGINNGKLSAEERKNKIFRYKEKQRKWRESHPISRGFVGRKLVARNKPRFKGKFVKMNIVERKSIRKD